jgi:hypothetical protein
VTGKGRKRKSAPAAPAVQPAEPIITTKAEPTALFAILRPLLVRESALILRMLAQVGPQPCFHAGGPWLFIALRFLVLDMKIACEATETHAVRA